jgi:hypothetical protein
MKAMFFLAIFSAACACPLRAGAQVISITGGIASEWRAGFVAGAAVNQHIIAERIFDTLRSPLILPPEGTGIELGVTAEFRFNDRLGVMGNLLFIDRSGESTQLLTEPVEWLEDATTGPHTMFAEHDVRYALVTTELLGTWRFARFDGDADIALAAGPAFSIVVDDNLRQVIDVGYDRRPNPGTPTSGQTGEIYVVHAGDIPGVHDNRFSFVAGLFADVNAGDFNLVPGIFYDFGLNELTTLHDWKLSGLDLRLAVRWEL